MPSDPPRVVSLLKSVRERAGVPQRALAQRVGVSRQALTEIEAGRQVPSTSLALELARALGCRVEDLFTLGPADSLDVELAPMDERSALGGRVVVGRVRGRWVAHGVGYSSRGADGVLLSGSDRAVRPLDDLEALSQNVLVAGCAPLLGLLAGAVSRGRGARVRWLHANSRVALDLLASDRVHAAGLHLGGDAGHGALVRRRFAGQRMIIVQLTRWRQGLVVAPGNPLGVREASDLLRPKLRLAHREQGAGATKLLRRLLRGECVPRGLLAGSHEQVGQLVHCGAADAGVAIEAVALSLGLGFVPLAEERFDLVLREEVAHEAPAVRLLDALEGSSFRAEARALAGYDTAHSGHATRIA